jgi:predicted phosphate transport protein (TIGR00153 family)
MRLDSLIHWFLPKQERFQELLGRDTQNLVQSARLFLAIAQTKSLAERRIQLVELKTLEYEGDQITRQIFEALNSTFITPFDREDLRSLAIDIDDILDYLESIAQFLVLFELEEAPEPLTHFAEILLELVLQVDQLTRLVWNMRNERELAAGIVRVSELENQADSLYLSVLAELFRKGGRYDAIDIAKWKEIYQGLEDACDCCKDFTHVLGNIVIKNA